MGQAWILVNFTKQQFIHPHTIGCGYKLAEIKNSPIFGRLLVELLSEAIAGESESDFDGKELTNPIIGLHGHWAGDQVALIGNYSQEYKKFKEEKDGWYELVALNHLNPREDSEY